MVLPVPIDGCPGVGAFSCLCRHSDNTVMAVGKPEDIAQTWTIVLSVLNQPSIKLLFRVRGRLDILLCVYYPHRLGRLLCRILG